MTEFTLHREVDVSGVSGTGEVAWGVEWPDGAVAIRWPGQHASTAAWDDIRGPEAIHGHGGKTVVLYKDSDRLLRAHQNVMLFLLNEQTRPITCAPHPDHPDRLRLTFKNEADWRLYVALLDGSTFTATHAEQAGEMRHRWVSPDGDLWLEYFTPLPSEDPLAIFDREDRPCD